MSDKMQVAHTNTLKRKASVSLTDENKLLAERSNDSDSDMDDDLVSFDKMLAGNSCFSDDDMDDDHTNEKTEVRFTSRATEHAV